jgi:hypothetical protein
MEEEIKVLVCGFQVGFVEAQVRAISHIPSFESHVLRLSGHNFRYILIADLRNLL